MNQQDLIDRINSKLNPQPGDTLVVSLREGDDPQEAVDTARHFFDRVEFSVMLLYPGQDIQQLDEEAMRRHGWVRDTTGRVAASVRACEGVPAGLLHDGAYREMIQAQTAQAAAFQQIIDMTRQQAEDKYGDPEKAEQWACVQVARAAMPKTEVAAS